MSLTAEETERVRSMWRELCGVPSAFRGSGVEVADAADIRSAPPGAISLVVLGDATAVAGPAVSGHRAALTALGAGAFVDLARIEPVLGPFARTLGPARLWYGHTDAVARHAVVGPLPADHALVAELLAGADAGDLEESGVTDAVAHVGVLARAPYRGRGCAASAAAVALRAAATAGLLPQWRAAHWNDESIGLARRLGLTSVGTQFSVRPAGQAPCVRS